MLIPNSTQNFLSNDVGFDLPTVSSSRDIQHFIKILTVAAAQKISRIFAEFHFVNEGN